MKETQTEQTEQATPIIKPLQAEFDLSKLLMSDIPLVDLIISKKPYPVVEAILMLDRVLIGGIKGRELTQYRPLMNKLISIISEIVNPKSAG